MHGIGNQRTELPNVAAPQRSNNFPSRMCFMPKYTRMAIGELAHGDLARAQVVLMMHTHANSLRDSAPDEGSGFLAYRILAEEGGPMIILETDWAGREQCLRYHASRSYRTLVGDTMNQLVGNYVTKIFKAD